MAESSTNHEDLWVNIFEKEIFLLKDTQFYCDMMIHESNNKNGFCYRRWNKDLKATEYLAYTGYFGAWTDNTSYYERVMMPNTQVHRNALMLKSVSWFTIYTIVDQIKVNKKSPIYDVFIYHAGRNGNCGINSKLIFTVNIGNETQKFTDNSFPNAKIKREVAASAQLVRHNVMRLDLTDLISKSDEKYFQVRCDYSNTSGHQSNYIWEGFSVINTSKKNVPDLRIAKVSQQPKSKIFDSGLLHATKVEPFKKFRLLTLQEEKPDEPPLYLSFDKSLIMAGSDKSLIMAEASNSKSQEWIFNDKSQLQSLNGGDYVLNLCNFQEGSRLQMSRADTPSTWSYNTGRLINKEWNLVVSVKGKGTNKNYERSVLAWSKYH